MDVSEKLTHILTSDPEMLKDLNASTVRLYRLVDKLISNGVTVQEWVSASNPPKEDGTYLVQTNTGTITTARFYAFKSFPATKYLPACHRSPSWQSNRNVVKWTFLPQPPKGE